MQSFLKDMFCQQFKKAISHEEKKKDMEKGRKPKNKSIIYILKAATEMFIHKHVVSSLRHTQKMVTGFEKQTTSFMTNNSQSYILK